MPIPVEWAYHVHRHEQQRAKLWALVAERFDEDTANRALNVGDYHDQVPPDDVMAFIREQIPNL